ncbi:hypothetical protein SCLCIDRAFT_978779 [Scleroderma citrinum Foug A]|uniref:Uncharacterized protein n=1 Tax=Scleroderma citrinum Foug A TaxID=1036808 RepID=A0A0C3DVA7_9AGAM|nr:hypothetical protein SCLCIDRAFT_978779 [Scleroderma citrinum Foug A]
MLLMAFCSFRHECAFAGVKARGSGTRTALTATELSLELMCILLTRALNNPQSTVSWLPWPEVKFTTGILQREPSIASLRTGRTHRCCTARYQVLCEAEPRHWELDEQVFIIVCRRRRFFGYNEPRNKWLCARTFPAHRARSGTPLC